MPAFMWFGHENSIPGEVAAEYLCRDDIGEGAQHLHWDKGLIEPHAAMLDADYGTALWEAIGKLVDDIKTPGPWLGKGVE
jgi:hypothetical protein